MKSSITANIEFYFKGEKFAFSEEIDIAAWLREHGGEVEALYDILAHKNGLDRYRHEYDVMILEPIHFSNATGLAAQYTHDGVFDIEGFISAYNKQEILSTLQTIAKKYLDIDTLSEHPKLQSALWSAYHAGKKTSLFTSL